MSVDFNTVQFFNYLRADSTCKWPITKQSLAKKTETADNILVLSRVRGSVTNNNAFRIG
jgi:hypothetical protein